MSVYVASANIGATQLSRTAVCVTDPAGPVVSRPALDSETQLNIVFNQNHGNQPF